MQDNHYVKWLENLTGDDVKEVGGKNASLGEMLGKLESRGIRVPNGFATTAEAYRTFIEENDLKSRIKEKIDDMAREGISLEKTGKAIRRMILEGSFPEAMAKDIRNAYEELSTKNDTDEIDTAVRSSATAEDLPEASFAGQQETFLNVSGASELLDACRKCYASLFTDRAISYRQEKGFDHMKIALSASIQKMVRSDKAGSGVMFTLDTETGFPDVVVINAAWGLGENVVQGAVTPDEYQVYKPLLNKKGYRPIIGRTLGAKQKKMVYSKGGSKSTKNIETSESERSAFVLENDEILLLAGWACVIEDHYGAPMDIEWAKDGKTGELFIVQARPETVQSQKNREAFKAYRLKEKGEVVVEGLAIGQAIAASHAQIIKDVDDIDSFEEGNILVTGSTDPDWVPIMKKSRGVVTDHGGRTSHAAIVSRELDVPAVVGCGNATDVIDNGSEITLTCAEGETGYIYEGILDFEVEDISLDDIPETRTPIMMNIASPDGAFRWWQIPVSGIGLARMEFIINNIIKVHPLALVDFDELEDSQIKREIEKLTRHFEKKEEYFIDTLSRGISRIAASCYPDRTIVRMSDFKTNEYADLLGGKQFERGENNPMLGFRGASRYYSERYRRGFDLECRAIRRARENLGFRNITIMIPFCRTLEEADQILEVLSENGLVRGENGLEVYVMCEIPSNVFLASEFAERFDGFSIGSNDLTQLVLGVDRDSEELSELFDERDEAVKQAIREIIEKAHEKDRKVGICGQAPSDKPDFAAFLVEAGIDSISLNPDSVIDVKRTLAGS